MPRILASLPSILVVWATVFNAILAIVNAHVVALSPTSVIAAEGVTFALAFVLVLTQFRDEMKVWCVLIVIILIIFLARSFMTGDLQVRYVRDVLIIPEFILLGMLCRRQNLTYAVCSIHLIVIVFMVLEAVNTELYSQLFEIQGYYINTRGYSDDNFWNKGSDLFVSAIRPQDRIFLAFLGLHRLSSIFLEPVSLGNYCVVITAYFCARFPNLSWTERWFLGLGNIAVLIGSDGRLAAVSSLIIIIVSLMAAKLPRGSAVLYLPVTTLIAIIVTNYFGFRDGPDDLAGRIAHTVELFARCDLEDFLGISEKFLWQAADSGIVYMILTQTIFGLVIIWIMIIFGAREENLEQTRYTHAIGIYLSLAMMVSFSIFTIKTAALLWFVQGVLQRREQGSLESSQMDPFVGLATPAEFPRPAQSLRGQSIRIP